MQKENVFFFSFPSASNFGGAKVTKNNPNTRQILRKVVKPAGFAWLSGGPLPTAEERAGT